MKNYSDADASVDIHDKLLELEYTSCVSKKDGCVVVEVDCDGCHKAYVEEIEVAKALTVSGASFLCLACDDEAKKNAFTGVTIEFGWRF